MPAWLTAFLLKFQRAFAIAVVAAQAGIAVTGSVVRVTGSGLGCPTWPECVSGSLVPVAHPEIGPLHQWVEFGNRTLTGVVGIIAGLCLLAAWVDRPRRPRVVKLALVQFGGVVVQAGIGGITVLTGLLWWTVGIHLMVSMGLTWAAVVLLAALREGDGPAVPLVSANAQRLQVVQAGVLGLLVLAGTFVTAAGPHAGDASAPRLDLPVPTLAQVHADLLFLFLGMLVGLGFLLGRHARRPYAVLVATVLAQGVIGMVQYWTGVPEVLVSVHVLGAGAVVIATAHLWTATRVRAHLDEVGLRSQTAGSSVASHA
ncbi:COX15/CtaA family protein [Saccharothrix obliqua]|uniref:COX15/CtaA family protein n=1 Tax=Saccharothrix obliqua TaxID=2861747 RepID=UPI001C60525F|nr:COX15/CtaA family protein [Saccharothrix obliqua]MBW4720915.1 COX15/CtaA family protein [Saccharothrix obliqua]